MTESCNRVLEQLGAELNPQLAEHARTCEHCQRVVAAHGVMGDLSPAEISAQAGASIRARAISELSRHPRARPWWRQAVLLSAINLMFVAAGVLGLGKQGLVLNAAPALVIGALAALLASVILAASFASLDPGHRWISIAALASVPPIGAAITLGGSGSRSSLGFVRAGLPCAFVEAALWIVPAAFALWALTGSAFKPTRAATAAIGSSAVGLLVLELHCSNGQPGHLLVFHVVPSLMLAALLIAIRSRLPSRSFAP